MSKKELHFDAAVTLEQAIYYLSRLAESLKTGPVRVSAGDREITIAPRDILGMDLEVSQKREKSKLTLELTWREYPAADIESLLRIEPAPAEEPEDADDAEAAADDNDAADADDDADDADDDESDRAPAAEAAPEPAAPAPGAAPEPSRPMRVAQ